MPATATSAPLEKGRVQVAGDYLSSLTETLNRTANGDDAAPVASSDVQATLAQLTRPWVRSTA